MRLWVKITHITEVVFGIVCYQATKPQTLIYSRLNTVNICRALASSDIVAKQSNISTRQCWIISMVHLLCQMVTSVDGMLSIRADAVAFTCSFGLLRR